MEFFEFKAEKIEQIKTIVFCKGLMQNKYNKEFDDVFKKLKTENAKISWGGVFLIKVIKKILKFKKEI